MEYCGTATKLAQAVLDPNDFPLTARDPSGKSFGPRTTCDQVTIHSNGPIAGIYPGWHHFDNLEQYLQGLAFAEIVASLP